MPPTISLRDKMQAHPVMGPVNLIPNPIVVEQLCRLPFDFIWTDMEHGPQTIHDLAAAVALCLGRGLTPLVRVPCAEDWAVKWVLDQGVGGIVFPFVNSPEEARHAVAACRYPPRGHRGYFPDVAAMRWGTDNAGYVQRANAEVCVILQIEHERAVQCVDEIAAVAGWDALFIGPMDLSSSYGKLGQTDDPQVANAITRVREAAHAAGGRVGILATDPADIRCRLDEGFDFILLNPDIAILRQALEGYWTAVRQAID